MRLLRSMGVGAFFCMLSACHPGEGERCNPLLFHDECGDGLACTYPPNCGVAYCCPPPPTTSVPMCTFPPDCSGDSCCPASAAAPAADPPASISPSCLPCVASSSDGGGTD